MICLTDSNRPWDDDTLHEECGVFGVFSKEDADCARLTYQGLFALQHRGQESCGIAVSNRGVVSHHKDMGLVGEVFTDEVLETLRGQMSVGHVRYSTAGKSVRENAQPLVSRYIKGSLSIAHNGNLTNAGELRRMLEMTGAIFQTTIDSEVIAYIVARERLACGSVEEAVLRAMPQISGSYSLLVMSPQKLIAVRDPMGNRPLCMGKIGDTIVFASETCALDAVGAEFVRDVLPGEIVVVGKTGITSLWLKKPERQATCIFEYIYFARPDSVIDGISVYEARLRAGKSLARKLPVDADLVMGVPDSGNEAAMGYALESGIPCRTGFVKNAYVGRTFIKPVQQQRERSVNLKLNPLKHVVNGKKVIMVDDSIVRGTTSMRIVRMLRNAGATEVHVRVSSPPFMWPCYYGTDIPNRNQLTACQNSIEDMCALIEADSLAFLDKDDLCELVQSKEKNFCDACFTGDYPIAPSDDPFQELDYIK